MEWIYWYLNNPEFSETNVWDWKQWSTYEDLRRNFLNKNINWRRVINLQSWNISELWWGVTTNYIWFNPALKAVAILEASMWSWLLDYTWSQWPELATKVMSLMINSKTSSDEFSSADVMRTIWWTEAITLLSDYFSEKEIFQCWPGYFMQYWRWNNITTIFNKEWLSSDESTFKTLPSIQEIDENVTKWSIIWIINPWISWEAYSSSDGDKILDIIREKKCTLVVDSAFEWTEVDGEDIVDFFELSYKKWLLENTIFLGSPSKWQWTPWKRLGYLATKNRNIMKWLISMAWSNRDWISLNLESMWMYWFLEIFNREFRNNPKSEVWELLSSIFSNYPEAENLFSNISELIQVDVMEEYLYWKRRFLSVMSANSDIFFNNVWEWKIFSWMSWPQKSLFNWFYSLPLEISQQLYKKYDINQIIRLFFLTNWLLLSPWQNFWWDRNFWEDKKLIFRWTFSQDPEQLENAIRKFSNWVQKLLNY